MRTLAAIHHIGNRWLLLVCLTTFLVSSVIWTSETVLGSCVVPTVPGNVSNIEKWVFDPVLYASSDTVQRQEEVDAWVDSQGWGSPPYTWTISGTGFSLTKIQTLRESEINIINADGSACGAASVTVTDARGKKDTGYVRCTSSGKWKLTDQEEWPCVYSTNTYWGCWGDPMGKYRYQAHWQSNMSFCDTTRGKCCKWLSQNASAYGLSSCGFWCNPELSNRCMKDGFEWRQVNHVRKYEWSCP